MDGLTSSDVDPLTVDTTVPEATQEVVTILFAPCVIGWILACFGAGYVASTSLSYMTGPLYRTDRPTIKLAVWLVLVFVLMSSALNANEIYHYLVSQARDYDTFSAFTTADALVCLPQAIVQAIVQIVLGERACSVCPSHFRPTVSRLLTLDDRLSGTDGSKYGPVASSPVSSLHPSSSGS